MYYVGHGTDDVTCIIVHGTGDVIHVVGHGTDDVTCIIVGHGTGDVQYMYYSRPW